LKKNHMTNNRAYRIFAIFAVVVLCFSFTATAFAADDPLAVVENLTEFIFSLIRAVGIILLGFGILQIGLSLKSHDPSQRANGMLTMAGGIVITFAQAQDKKPCPKGYRNHCPARKDTDTGSRRP